MAYEDALQELYQVSLAQFVTERKRLAGELKASGDGGAAKQLLERKRPTMSAWVVNQLYWHARDAFDEMLATAEQLRNGHLAASGAHRDAIAKLRRRAATILEDAGHAATEATLRRVTATLAALSATGGFDPDPAGALAADRDPPGFEAAGIPSTPAQRAPTAAPGHQGTHELDEARAAHARRSAEEAEARRREEMAEQRRAEEERRRRRAERHRVEAALRTAEGELVTRERAIGQLENQLEHARRALESARQTLDALRAQLAELGDD